MAHSTGLHAQWMIRVCVGETCHVGSHLFIVASPQFTWLDQGNVIFMRLCTVVFFDKWPLWQHWNSVSEGCMWHVDMHDILLGDVIRLLYLHLATKHILECVGEQDFCIYIKLKALTGSQQTYKKGSVYACRCAFQLCITLYSFIPDAKYCRYIHIVSLCMFSISVAIMSIHTVHLRTECHSCIICFFGPISIFFLKLI